MGFVQDPSGNSLEFKAMRNPANLFAKYTHVESTEPCRLRLVRNVRLQQHTQTLWIHFDFHECDKYSRLSCAHVHMARVSGRLRVYVYAFGSELLTFMRVPVVMMMWQYVTRGYYQMFCIRMSISL